MRVRKTDERQQWNSIKSWKGKGILFVTEEGKFKVFVLTIFIKLFYKY
jgi:hypothetical protein